MAIFGVAPLGVFFAGWASNNKYTLIGGMRSAAQLTAYEIPLLITVLGVAVLSGSLNIIEIVDFQMGEDEGNVWNFFMMPLGAALFLITMIAEVERIPFDMPEAEAELVEGWWTEYGGIRWGLMFSAEYMRSYAACILFALFFLGGWEAPFQHTLSDLPVLGGAFTTLFAGIPGLVWVLLKAWSLFAVFVWIRASLHRVRSESDSRVWMEIPTPLSLVNLIIATYLRLELYDGGNWNLWIPVVITTVSFGIFLLYIFDEDEEAARLKSRPYSTQAVIKASPEESQGLGGSMKEVYPDEYNTGHPRATPNFRNLVLRPMWMTLKTALRTFPFVGRLWFLRNEYHGRSAVMIDKTTKDRIGEEHPSAGQKFAADRETSQIMPFLERPVTVMYPYERLEDLEPWLFVPGNYNGRIGVIWETCTACKACVRACPNDCLHMTSEVRVNVLDTTEEGDEWHGYGSELEAGGFAARPREDSGADNFDLMTAHKEAQLNMILLK